MPGQWESRDVTKPAMGLECSFQGCVRIRKQGQGVGSIQGQGLSPGNCGVLLKKKTGCLGL